MRRPPMVALLAALGCVSAQGPAPPPTPPAAPPRQPAEPVAESPLARDELETQSLFRVRYDGPDGDGGLRLVLRLATPERFQLSAADALGRAAWSVDVEPHRALLVYHRDEAYCVTAGEVRLPETALAPLPLRALPRVLLGYLPVPPPAESDAFAEGGFVDAGGRRWSATPSDGAPAAWTLWDPDEPLLWWTRQPKGGILSHREGVQFRWRRVVNEPLGEPLSPLSPPAGYERRSCDGSRPQELRQGQPPLGGAR